MGNINQRLNGLNALAYLGVNAVQPPDFVTKKGPPTASDSKNFYLGQIWLDVTSPTPAAANVWMLVAINDNQATWINFAGGGGGGTVTQFTADAGTNPVLPDGTGNVNLFGSHGINTDATANTLTFAINNDIELGDLTPIAFGAPALRAVTGNVQIDSGNLTLPATTDEDVGVIQINGNSFLHAFGSVNTFVGQSAGNFTLVSANSNVGVGTDSLIALTSGSFNVAVGLNSANALTSGSQNVILGQNSGGTYTTSESSNVLLNAAGIIADNNTIRIADSTGGSAEATSCYVGGIYGITPGGSGILNVTIDNLGQLGTAGATPSGATDFVTDTGTAFESSGIINILAQNASLGAGSSVSFSAPGATDIVQLNVTDVNNNTIIGRSGGNLTLTGTDNTALGAGGVLRALTSGADNVAIGFGSANSLTSGNQNLILGQSSGSAYATNESFNVLLNAAGTVSESNTIRIADTTAGSAQASTCYIGGISGVTPAGAVQPVMINASGQLGSSPVVAFQARCTTVNTNVTGDGTTFYTIIYDTVNFDISSSYDNTTGIFTAPVNGIYHFTASAHMQNMSSGHTSGYIAMIGVGAGFGPLLNPFACMTSGAPSDLSVILSYDTTVSLTVGTPISAGFLVGNSTLTVGSGADVTFAGFLVAPQ